MALKAGILTIGHELLSGFTVDTNSAWIGQNLLNIGIQVTQRISVGDVKDEIQNALNYIDRDSDIIIITGGLGPTHDDVTQSTIFDYFKSKPIFDDKYWEILVERYSAFVKTVSDVNRNQAIIPDNGQLIPNPLGSARGLHYKKKRKHYFCLPGVPSEMKIMMNETILPLLEKISDTEINIRTIRTTGIPESTLVEVIGEKRIHSESVNIAFLPQSPGVDIRVTGENQSDVDLWVNDVKDLLGNKVYGEDNTNLEAIVASQMIDRKFTLSVAESCTGGFLGHRITSVSGSSKYFVGGVLSYDNHVKRNLLHVSEFDLHTHGAVSEEVARHMAEGVRDLLKTDFGIAITGIAGPTGGTADKPVGLVYIGIATPEETFVKEYQFKTNRDFNKLLATERALNLLRMYLIDHE